MEPCLVLILNSLARAEDELGRFLESERLYRRALTLLKNGDNAQGIHYAVILSNLGSLYVEEGKIEQGEAMLRESLTMYAGLLPAGDERVAATRNGLAEALMQGNKYREAERFLEQSLAIFDKEPQPRTMLAVTLSNLGVIRRMQGRNRDAVPLFERLKPPARV